MTWLCVDKNKTEWAFDGEPERGDNGWYIGRGDCTSAVELPKGSIKKLTGHTLTWKDCPIEI